MIEGIASCAQFPFSSLVLSMLHQDEASIKEYSFGSAARYNGGRKDDDDERYICQEYLDRPLLLRGLKVFFAYSGPFLLVAPHFYLHPRSYEIYPFLWPLASFNIRGVA